MGVQESIIPAAVAPMVSPDRRASAYGLFTGVYGTAWVARQHRDRRPGHLLDDVAAVDEQ